MIPATSDGAIRLLVFDLDGTLVPTMEDYADRAAELMAVAFGTPFAEARKSYFATSGLPFERQLRQLYPGQDTDPVAERFEAWKDGYLAGIAISPEVTDLLRGWRAQGFLVAISSNNLEIYVERLARDWPVDCALGYRAPSEGDPGFAKGEPHFRALEQHFGLDRSTFVHRRFTERRPHRAGCRRALSRPPDRCIRAWRLRTGRTRYPDAVVPGRTWWRYCHGFGNRLRTCRRTCANALSRAAFFG